MFEIVKITLKSKPILFFSRYLEAQNFDFETAEGEQAVFAYADPHATLEELRELYKMIDDSQGKIELIVGVDFGHLDETGCFGSEYLAAFKRDIALHSDFLLMTAKSLEFLSGIAFDSQDAWPRSILILKTMGVKNACVFDSMIGAVLWDFEDCSNSYFENLKALPESNFEAISLLSYQLLKARIQGDSYTALSNNLMAPFVEEKLII